MLWAASLAAQTPARITDKDVSASLRDLSARVERAELDVNDAVRQIEAMIPRCYLSGAVSCRAAAAKLDLSRFPMHFDAVMHTARDSRAGTLYATQIARAQPQAAAPRLITMLEAGDNDVYLALPALAAIHPTALPLLQDYYQRGGIQAKLHTLQVVQEACHHDDRRESKAWTVAQQLMQSAVEDEDARVRMEGAVALVLDGAKADVWHILAASFPQLDLERQRRTLRLAGRYAGAADVTSVIRRGLASPRDETRLHAALVASADGLQKKRLGVGEFLPTLLEFLSKGQEVEDICAYLVRHPHPNAQASLQAASQLAAAEPQPARAPVSEETALLAMATIRIEPSRLKELLPVVVEYIGEDSRYVSHRKLLVDHLAVLGPRAGDAAPVLRLLLQREKLYCRASVAVALLNINPGEQLAVDALRSLLLDGKEHVTGELVQIPASVANLADAIREALEHNEQLDVLTFAAELAVAGKRNQAELLAIVSRRANQVQKDGNSALAKALQGVADQLRSERKQEIRVAMIGDSTMASYARPPKDRPDLTGWGQVFGEYFSERVKVLNHAASGRSSKSFLSEGRWQPVLDAKPQFIFIQFGHNDQPGKGDRSTKADGDFQDNLSLYVKQARAIGATPILVTPVARRSFADGKAVTTLTPYADAVKQVAKATNTPLVDLHAFSLAHFDALGDEGSADYSPSAADRTHFSRKGALAIAKLVADALPTAVPKLAEQLKPPTNR
ncbi:MAG: rhamnogalacturonan acetylesterase [Planctomycetales bacterium]|nr:rhamnogalacturonan acetylesterase [Planctomycetales bacterium]